MSAADGDSTQATVTSRSSDTLAAFALLPPDVRRLVEQAVRRRSLSFGQVVVREGDDADGWYVVEAGRARVLRTAEDGKEVPLGMMEAGDGFGEISLLEGGRRTATVRAASELTVLHLDAGVFAALVRAHPEVDDAMRILVRKRQLNDFLRRSPAFSALPPELLGEVLSAVAGRELADGEVLYAEGAPATDMAVLRRGRLRIRKRFGGEERDLAWLRPGEVVGERAVLRGGTRSATVLADGPCLILEIPGAMVHRMVAESPAFARQSELRERLYQRRDSGAASGTAVPLDMADELLPAQAQDAVVSESQVSESQVSESQVSETQADAEPDASSLGPFASPEGHFVQGERIKRFPLVRQLDAMDCGAASLGMVCRHFGRRVSLTRIRALVGTGYDGTSLSGICDGARALGLAARAVKVSRSRLDQLPLPAIVHMDANHWAVLWDVTDDQVKLADPGAGQRTLARDAFQERWSGYAALFDHTEAFEDAPESTPSVAWLWRFARPYRSSLLRAAGLALVVSALQMVLPVFTQVIVDRVLVEGDVVLLHWLVGAMFATMVLMTGASLLQRYLLSWSAVRIDLAAFDFLTRRLLDLPMPYFATRRVGDIQRRLLGARQVREFLVEHGVTMLQAVCQLAAALVVMSLYSWKLSLVFVLLAPLYLGLMRWSRTRMRPLFNDLEEAYGKYASNQIDGIKGIESVKSMGAEARLRERLLAEFTGLASKQFEADYTRMAFGGAMQSVDYLARVLFLLLAAHQVIDGAMSIGELVAFTALAALATQPIQTLLGLYDNLQIVSVLVDRLGDVFESEPEQGHDRAHLRPVPTLEGRLTLQNLGFRYGGADAPMILQGISVDIPPGTRVAVVGRSGSGKSTLIKVLTGMLVPSEGRVLYDTVDMAGLDLRALRRRIGVVLQDSFLFSDSIARNIAFADPEPDEAKVRKAAQAAAAAGFVERLPLSYQTRVGESGLRLSGGQAQRISIARALYEEPPVLIFDEATSALDSESERAVKENMDQFLAGRTSIVIAHRLSTIRDADLILVLEQGRLVEQGTHDELLEREGLYQYLVSQQLGL